MEETQNETPKPSKQLLSFPPHRRRQLNSATYRTLVRILSHCRDESQHSLPAQSFSHELNTDDSGSNESGKRTEKEASEHVALVGSDNMELGIPASQGLHMSFDDTVSLGDTQMAIDQIEQIMNTAENEDVSNQNNVIVNEPTFGISFQDQGFGPEQMLTDELQHIIKGNEDLIHENTLKPSTTPLDQDKNGIDIGELLNNQEEHVDFQQNFIIMSGNVSEKLCNSFDSSFDNIKTDENSNPRDNFKEKHSPSKTIVLDTVPIMRQKERETENMGSTGGPKKSPILNTEVGDIEEEEHHKYKVSETFDMSSDKNTVSDHELQNYSLKANSMEVEHEILSKDKESKKSDCMSDAMDSANYMTGEEDIEEGEISADYTMDDDSMDMMLQNGVGLEDKKVDEENISRCLVDKKELLCNEVNEQDFKSTSSPVSTANNTNNGGVELRESDGNKMVYRPEIIVNRKTVIANKLDGYNFMLEAARSDNKGSGDGGGVLHPASYPINNRSLHRQILEEEARNHKITSIEKQDAEVCNKKKRGPPSKEKKARKKQKERKKRAEKNRQLGVKRLKLVPMSKPKTVTYCRHYLKGRCHEGDNCKFSHDTVPLTKSKPCCHFARHSCMKGDECPFDHQLSKYPCSNFASKGFCIRGDDCMFSHKIPPTEDTATASDACKPELKPVTMLDNSKFKDKLNNDGASQKKFNASCYSTKIESRNNEQKVKETVLKQSGLVSTKGTSFLSVENSLLVDSSDLRQGNLNRYKNASGKAGNLIHQSALASVQNSNEILNKTPPVVAPRGINFLSFGKAPSDASSSRESTSLPDSGVKVSLLDNSNLQNHASLTLNSNMVLNGGQPPVSPKGINSLSFGKASIDDSGGKDKDSLPCKWDNGTDRSVQEKQLALDKLQVSNASSSAERLTSSPVSSAQFSGNLASRIYKDTPLSAQKALLSTLAFAAKYDSGMKLKQSIGSAAVNTKVDKETMNTGNIGCSQNDSIKASKILEFLSSMGCKTKQ